MRLGLFLDLVGQGSGLFEPTASLALDFTTGRYRVGTGGYSTPDFASLPNLTVTRATPSVAYGTTSAGVLVPFAANVARITDQGLLVEEARTNIAQQSQTLDNAYWDTKTNLSVTADATAAPDGTLTADKLVENTTASVVHTLARGLIAATTATAYTLSVFAKPAGRTAFRFGPIFGLNNVQFFVDLSAGTTNTLTGGTAPVIKITALANGWYRISVSDTSTATEVDPSFTLVSTGTTTSYTGDGVSGVYLWGAQLELGSFPTSYIPTTSASVTRAADSVSIGGLTIPTAGTVYAETYADQGGIGQKYMVEIGDGTFTNSFDILDNRTNTSFWAESHWGATSGTQFGAFTIPGIKKAAMNWVSTTNTVFRFTGTGATVGTATNAAAMPAMTGIALGYQRGGGPSNYANEYIRKAVIYPTALSDAQLQALTQ